MLDADRVNGYVTLKERGQELVGVPNTAKKYADRSGIPLYKSLLDLHPVLVRADDVATINDMFAHSIYPMSGSE